MSIETTRLLLRRPQLEHLDRWADMMADEESARYVGGVQAKSVVWRSIMSQAGAWALTGVAMFSVLEKATGQWIGRIGPWQPFEWPGTEVGWSLHRDAWGKGYAAKQPPRRWTTPSMFSDGRRSFTASTLRTCARSIWRNGSARSCLGQGACLRPTRTSPLICGANRAGSGRVALPKEGAV